SKKMNTFLPIALTTFSKSESVILVSHSAAGIEESLSMLEAVKRAMLAALEKPPARVVPENVTLLKKKNRNAVRYKPVGLSCRARRKYFLISAAERKPDRSCSSSSCNCLQTFRLCTDFQKAMSSLNWSLIQYCFARLILRA